MGVGLIMTKKELRLIKVVFITENGEEIEKNQLTGEQYKFFCDKFEMDRIKNRIIWPDIDEKYNKKNEDI